MPLDSKTIDTESSAFSFVETCVKICVETYVDSLDGCLVLIISISCNHEQE